MASRTKKRDYPAHVSLMISQDMRDLIDAEAEEQGVFISDVIRDYLTAAIEAKYAPPTEGTPIAPPSDPGMDWR